MIDSPENGRKVYVGALDILDYRSWYFFGCRICNMSGKVANGRNIASLQVGKIKLYCPESNCLAVLGPKKNVPLKKMASQKI